MPIAGRKFARRTSTGAAARRDQNAQRLAHLVSLSLSMNKTQRFLRDESREKVVFEGGHYEEFQSLRQILAECGSGDRCCDLWVYPAE
jgi:hypothetical protein